MQALYVGCEVFIAVAAAGGWAAVTFIAVRGVVRSFRAWSQAFAGAKVQA